MSEIAKYTQQETVPVENKTATAKTQTPEGSYSFVETLIGFLYNRLKDSDEELAKKRTELEKRLAVSIATKNSPKVLR